MRVDDGVVKQFSATVQAGNLAAVAEARIEGHRALLPHWRAQQQLAQVLAEDLDALYIRPVLGLSYHFAAD